MSQQTLLTTTKLQQFQWQRISDPCGLKTVGKDWVGLPCGKQTLRARRETFTLLGTVLWRAELRALRTRCQVQLVARKNLVLKEGCNMEQVHSREDEFPISRDIQGKKFSPSMNISNLFLPHMYSLCSSHQEGTLLSPLGIHFLQTLQGLVEVQHFPQSPDSPHPHWATFLWTCTNNTSALYLSIWLNSSIHYNVDWWKIIVLELDRPAFESNGVFLLTFLDYFMRLLWGYTMWTQMQSAQHG